MEICKLPEEQQVQGEDWDALMWHNGRLFSSSNSNGMVSVWSRDLEAVSDFKAHDGPVNHMCGTNDRSFYTGAADGNINYWEDMGHSFGNLGTLTGHTKPIKRMRFLQGKLFTADEAGNIKIWRDGNCVGTLETGKEILDMQVYPDNQIAVAIKEDINIYTVKYPKEGGVTAEITNTFQGKAPLQITGKDHLERFMCCVDRLGYLANIHKLKTGEKVGTTPPVRTKSIINTMSSVGYVLITGTFDNGIVAYNLKGEIEVTGRRLEMDGAINVICTAPDGRSYAAGENKFITCFKVEQF